MDVKQLKKQVNQIEISKEMEEEIIKNCYKKLEDESMNKTNMKKFNVKPFAAAAAMALCLSLVGITAMAATGKMDGFFENIKNWTGAVTGTVYQQATDEVEVTSCVTDGKVVVTLTMLEPNIAPYSTFETFGIEKYQIVDLEGRVISEGTTEMVEVLEENVEIDIVADDMTKGYYKLVITQLIGGSKADQPLVLNGNWESEFSY